MHKFTWVIVSFLLLAMLACAAPASPPPSPTAITPAQKPPAAPTSTISTPSSQDAAWAKVVDAAKKEGKVTIYSFNLIGDLAPAITKTFEDKYGIKIEIVTGLGTVLIERLKTEGAAKKYIADAFDTASSLVATAKTTGLTASVGDLPVLAEKDVWYLPPRLDTEGHIIVINPSPTSIYINTKLITPGGEPKSYRELLDSKWKGKIGISTPVTDPVPIYSYVARKQMGLEEDYWRQLSRQDLKIVPSRRDVDNLLARGEVPLIYAASASTTGPLIKEGAPMKAVEVEEGVIMAAGPGITLLKEAPHPNAARLFINWLLSAEGQKLWSEKRGSLGMRKDVPDYQHPATKMPLKKVIYQSLDDVLELSKVQREGTMAKLLGLEK